MKTKILFATLLFALAIVGLQAAPTVSAAPIVVDKFMVKHPGGGQSGDADAVKVYKYGHNHFYIHTNFYNWNAKHTKYVRNGDSMWMDLKKISKNKIRVLSPSMEGKPSVDIIFTTHSVEYYYWKTLRKELKQNG